MSSDTLSIFDGLAADDQRALTDMLQHRQMSIAESNKVLRETTADIRSRGWDTHYPLWNACLFLNTIAYDHSVQLSDLIYEKDTWKRNLIARNLCILLYETAEDVPVVFGQRFNKSLNDLNVDPETIRSFRAELKKMSTFWRNHRTMLKDIRTMCGAHRDHDALALYNAIETLDLVHVITISTELGTLLNKIGQASEAILNATSSIQAPELSSNPKAT